jgi:DNA relaxase NicK
MRLFSYLHNQGAKANRLDTYADDRRGKFAELRPLIESAVDANQQVGFRDDSYHWSRKDGVKRETYNLGSRSSQSYHRIYDKEDRVRWEREIKEGKADCMFSLACKAFESLDGSTDFDILMGSLIRDSIFSSVNFIERNGKNLERGKRLEWWEDFLKSLEVQPLKLASVKRVSCFHKMRDWVDKSVAKVLAKMQAVFPDFPVWIRRVVEQGQDRLSNSDKAMIEAFNREVREREREFSNRMEERGMEERENEKRFFERMRE